MKPINLLISTFIPFTAAVPVQDTQSTITEPSIFNLAPLNNLNYLLNINALDLQLLSVLGSLHHFNTLGFRYLFQAPSFDVQRLLQLQQLQTLLQFERLGLFNGFDLAGLKLDLLQLSLINGVGVLNLAQFIPRRVLGQVETVAERVVVIKVPEE